jgi:hypothetical protein
MLKKATDWETVTQGQKKTLLPFPEHHNTQNLDILIFTLLLVRSFI